MVVESVSGISPVPPGTIRFKGTSLNHRKKGSCKREKSFLLNGVQSLPLVTGHCDNLLMFIRQLIPALSSQVAVTLIRCHGLLN